MNLLKLEEFKNILETDVFSGSDKYLNRKMIFALNYNLGTRLQRFPMICFRASKIYMGDVSYYFCFCNESCGTFRIYEWEEDEVLGYYTSICFLVCTRSFLFFC